MVTPSSPWPPQPQMIIEVEIEPGYIEEMDVLSVGAPDTYGNRTLLLRPLWRAERTGVYRFDIHGRLIEAPDFDE